MGKADSIKSITGIILSLCLFMAIASGCGAGEGEQSVSQMAEMVSDAESVSGESVGNTDLGGNSMSDTLAAPDTEMIPEAVNALELPLMDGTVLLVIVTRYRSNDDYQKIVAQYEYDSQGNILRAAEEESSRIEYSNIEYEYDTEGRLSRKTCYEAGWRDWREKNWKLSYWVEYSYTVNEADGTMNRMERKYDGDGILCEEFLYDSQEKLLKEIFYRDNALSYEYEYDRQENQSWGISYDRDGNITRQYREDYDDMGNRILSAHYDGEGNLDVFEGYECDTYVVIYPYWRYENTYDNTGNLIRWTEYDYDNAEAGFCEYTYDEKGRLVEEFFSDEMTTDSYEYEYDSAGNQVRMLHTYYESDDAGNLTAHGSGTVWEREYDRENRLVKYDDWGRPKEWYEYEYELIGVSEGDYPYDRIKIRQYF